MVPAIIIPAIMLLVLAAPLQATASAQNVPETVPFAGRFADSPNAAGVDLSALTLTYFSTAGEKLFTETIAGVEVSDGQFEITLGSGAPGANTSFTSLGSVFSRHPEVRLEISLGDTIYEPRLGILPAGHSLRSRLVAAAVRPA